MENHLIMEATAPATRIHWRQILPLFGLDLAILISWIAYHEYQPVLLKKFEFTELTLFLLTSQAIILLLTPPLAGWIADRLNRKGASHLPVINVGVSFVSMVFMVVAVTIFTEPSGALRTAFPIMIVLWLISMNIFHSPAISTVEQFVPKEKLPEVMAIFAILADLTQAIEPVLIDITELVGAPLTFAAGGLLVFGTGWWFSLTVKKFGAENQASERKPIPPGHNSVLDYAKVFLYGTLTGGAVAMFFDQFPNWAETRVVWVQSGSMTGGSVVAMLIVVAALLSWPLGKWMEGRKLLPILGISALVAGLLAAGFYLSSGLLAILCLFLFPVAFAFLSVSALPLAFGQLSGRHKIFGIGLFFGGLELVSGIVRIVSAAS